MGRHLQRTAPWQLTRRPALLAGLVVVALAASAVTVRAVSSSTPAAQAGCAGPTTTLNVGVDPAAAPWLTPLAESYTRAARSVAGRCVTLAVRQLTLAQAQQALQPVPFPGGGTPPDVWVPESTTAVELVRARPGTAKVLGDRAPPLASSPIVVAAPPETLRALAKRLPTGRPRFGDVLALARNPAGWGQPGVDRPEWGPVRFSTADPGTTTLGTNLLIATAGALTGTPAREVRAATFGQPEAKQGLLSFVRTVASTPPSAGALFAAVERATTTADLLARVGVVVAYEKDVWHYNGQSPAVVLQAAYPLAGQLAADFPFVVPDASWVDDADRAAAADFRGWLLSEPIQARLGAAGLRRADGRAGPELTTGDRGLDGLPRPPEPLRAADGPAAARSAWKLVTQRVSILALFDVSGSMAELVPGTRQSKLDVARAAAQASLGFFDGQDAIGLWEFSRALDGDRDYRELMPLGPVGAPVNGFPDRRAASIAAYRTMVPRTATGLYDTVLAGYRDAVAHYRPGFINTVVVLTDGRNEDPGSITLPALVTELKRRYDPARPVHIVTLAYGSGADPAALAQLARATDGLQFTSVDPRTIGQVFLTAVAALTA
jgi:Ca-activated chloride channel family protein